MLLTLGPSPLATYPGEALSELQALEIAALNGYSILKMIALKPNYLDAQGNVWGASPRESKRKAIRNAAEPDRKRRGTVVLREGFGKQGCRSHVSSLSS